MHLRLRLHSEFWSIPEDEYERILAVVGNWIDEQPEGPLTEEQMTPFLTTEVFRWT